MSDVDPSYERSSLRLGNEPLPPPKTPEADPAPTKSEPAPATPDPAVVDVAPPPEPTPEPAPAKLAKEYTPEEVETILKENNDAKAVMAMAKEDPAEFSRQFGANLAPQYAELSKRSAEARKREQAAKEAETNSQKAVEAMKLLEHDPVAFADKHLGDGGFERLTRLMLSKNDPSMIHLNAAEKKMAELEQKIKEMGEEGKLGTTKDENPEAEAYYQQQATEFWSDFGQLSKAEENQKLLKFYTADEINRDAYHLVTTLHKSTGKLLTGAEVWGMLNKEFTDRVGKLNPSAIPPAAATPNQPTQAEPGSDQGPTLNANLQASPERVEVAEDDFSPAGDRRRMAVLAAKYRR